MTGGRRRGQRNAPRFELTEIESELDRYLATPRARKLLAFRKYLEQRERRAA